MEDINMAFWLPVTFGILKLCNYSNPIWLNRHLLSIGRFISEQVTHWNCIREVPRSLPAFLLLGQTHVQFCNKLPISSGALLHGWDWRWWERETIVKFWPCDFSLLVFQILFLLILPCFMLCFSSQILVLLTDSKFRPTTRHRSNSFS